LTFDLDLEEASLGAGGKPVFLLCVDSILLVGHISSALLYRFPGQGSSSEGCIWGCIYFMGNWGLTDTIAWYVEGIKKPAGNHVHCRLREALTCC
jgi:hypothetical protein